MEIAEKATRQPNTITVTCASCPSNTPRLRPRFRRSLIRLTIDFDADAMNRNSVRITAAMIRFGKSAIAESTILLPLCQALLRCLSTWGWSTNSKMAYTAGLDLCRPTRTARMPAPAIEVGRLFHGLALRAAILAVGIRRATTVGMCAFLSFAYNDAHYEFLFFKNGLASPYKLLVGAGEPAQSQFRASRSSCVS
jgi:hypothetical protein